MVFLTSRLKSGQSPRRMLTQFASLFFFIIAVFAILVVYTFKTALQLQLLKIERHQPPGRTVDLFFFDFGNRAERSIRMDAFLKYPLMFPVVIEEDDNDEVVVLKKKIKTVNYGLYFLLIVLIITNTLNS